MINPKILVIVTLFVGGSSIMGAGNIFAQGDSGIVAIGNSLRTYKDPDIDISFQYPSYWTVQKITPAEELYGPYDVRYILMIDIGEDIEFTVDAVPLDLLSPPITTLKDFARYQYTRMGTLNVVNDSQTTVAGDHPALQMEYIFNHQGQSRHGLNVWTIDRGKGYEFTYTTNEGPEFSANIPSIRKMLDSIEFIPLAPPPEEPPTPKEPSFMN